MPYLAHFSLKWKNKTTLFSSTLKVEENKVVLFFHFKPNWARYGRFLVYKEISTKRPKGNLGPNQDRTKNTSERSEIFCGVSGTLMEPEKQGFQFRFWNHHFKGGPNCSPIHCCHINLRNFHYCLEHLKYKAFCLAQCRWCSNIHCSHVPFIKVLTFGQTRSN